MVSTKIIPIPAEVVAVLRGFRPVAFATIGENGATLPLVRLPEDGQVLSAQARQAAPEGVEE